jgi:iron complex transport system substrate-binding protein
MYATIFVKGRLKKSVAIGLGLGIALASLTGVSADAKAPKPFPVKIKTALGVVTIKSAPKAIISLSPTATEILFAIGAGKQVLAVDDQSNYPTNAPISKIAAYTPNLEAIAGMHPDLVVDSNDTSGGVVVSAGLAKFGIKTIEQPAADHLSDTYTQIVALGAATGHAKEASKLIISMKKRIANAIASVKRTGKTLTFYQELDPTPYSATSNTFIGRVYTAFGLKNIADAATGADKSGYPQLTSEYILASNPDLIFLGDAQYGESARTVAARPGFSGLKAVQNSGVIALPADYPSRWGPRIADFYGFVAQVIKKIG